jgi:hypothetical protein
MKKRYLLALGLLATPALPVRAQTGAPDIVVKMSEIQGSNQLVVVSGEDELM